jgi:predicted TIM-barrel fold metal-dependent hydrolase
MPVRGMAFLHVIEPYYRHALAGHDGLDWFDAHTHIGDQDPDGQRATADEILEGMDRAGVRRALLFAMHEPAGYPPANDAVLAACAASEGRLIPLCRVDPNADPLPEVRRCLEAGAVGVKLHPRSDEFTLPHPAVEEIAALANERRMPILFHAGRGIPNLGEAVADLARRYADARFILAHAGISDLGAIGPAAAELSNLLFDTSWWQVSDLLAMYTTIPPGQIVYGSDMPYGPSMFGAWATLRLTNAVGLGPEAVRSIAGEQLGRVVAGEDLLDLGPAVGPAALGPRNIGAERAVSYLTTATLIAFRGMDPREILAFARLACQTAGPDDPATPLMSHVERFLAVADDLVEQYPEEPQVASLAVVCAELLAGSPGVAVPDLAAVTV